MAHKYGTGSDRGCVETQFAASPPDVRKGSALPARADGIWGYAPSRGHSPGLIGDCLRWGGAATAHRAAQPRTGVSTQSLKPGVSHRSILVNRFNGFLLARFLT